MRKSYLIKIAAVIIVAAALIPAGLIFTALAAEAENSGPYWDFAEFYKYDRELPLNLEEKKIDETDLYTLYHWAYDGTHDKRVTAQLSVPKGLSGPAPVFLFVSGYPGSKEDINKALDLASSMGYACLSIDAEYLGERKVEGKDIYSKLPYSSRDAMIQTVVDYRRGIDILETKPEIDSKRVGYVGASMGGIFGGVMAGVEPRFRATVLAVGGADWGYLLKASVVAAALGLGAGEHPLDPKEFRRIVAPADPINWAQDISPRPVLMLNAKHDILVNPKSNMLLFWRLKAPKKIIWFDEGHELPFDTAINYAMEFFDKYLTGDEDPAGLGVQIAGHETEPMPMAAEKELPPPRTNMPLDWLYEYEDFLPLKEEVKEVAPPPAGAAAAYDVSFLSVHDKRVTGRFYLPGPPEKGPYPAAVFVHQYGEDSSEAEKILPAAEEAGFAVLAMDLEYHGKRALPGRELVSPLYYTSRDAAIQTVFDLRRAMDFLETRKEIRAAEKGFAIIKYGVTLDLAIQEVTKVDKRAGVVVVAQESMKKAMEKIGKIYIDDESKIIVGKAFGIDMAAGPEGYAVDCVAVKSEEGFYAKSFGTECRRVETVAEALSGFAGEILSK